MKGTEINNAISTVDKAVQEQLICSRYVQLGSFNKVAREFDMHPQTVKRIWERLPEAKKTEFTQRHNGIVETAIETVARIEAEMQAGDFYEKVASARNKALGILIKRLDNSVEGLNGISDKELLNSLRLLHSMSAGGDGADNSEEGSNFFTQFNISIQEDMVNKKV